MSSTVPLSVINFGDKNTGVLNKPVKWYDLSIATVSHMSQAVEHNYDANKNPGDYLGET